MAIPKPAKSVSKTKLREKCDRLASLYYRRRTPYCEAAGLGGVECGGGLQWAHIFSRSILHIRYEHYNNLVLCAGHHIYWTHNPIEWTRFLEAHFPERLGEAEANRYKFWKVDYERWIEYFSRSVW